ncbi:hypothetical protein CLV97_11089 [Planifilum fimeticola]|uniref:Uncharacterized protein n=1 Tax=Planifilum fimeticola TaxID=201975 RepID=A0A2T0LFB9_9BACL|nr:hypothetical protein [Planifilum fimeticola]PRX40897.1 hypothetical protein CLV97_11089 [Planifilum fimeticola]
MGQVLSKQTMDGKKKQERQIFPNKFSKQMISSNDIKLFGTFHCTKIDAETIIDYLIGEGCFTVDEIKELNYRRFEIKRRELA